MDGRVRPTVGVGGVTALDEWSYEYADVAVSNLVEFDGLSDLPDMDTNDSPRMGVDGDWRGEDFARGRTFTVKLDNVAATDSALADALASFKAAFGVRRSTDAAFRFRFGGEVAKRIYCRTVKRSIPDDYGRITRLMPAVVQLRAADPRIYADDQSNGSTLIGSTGAGMSWPATWDLSWGGASSAGQIDAANDGDADAPWTATLSGQLVNPYLVCGGHRLSFTGTVETGDFLTLDSLNRTVLLNGAASRYEWVDVGAEWFQLTPGANTVQFGADSGDGILTLVWRSTWL